MTRKSGFSARLNGAMFEAYIERAIFAPALASGYFARIDKQNPSCVAVRSQGGVSFRPRKASGADWIALGGWLCSWNYIAIEAKHTDAQSLALSELSTEQIAHLSAAESAGQLGLLLVRFSTRVYACRWTDVLFTPAGHGRSLKEKDCYHLNEICGDRSLQSVLGRWHKIA